MKKISLFTAGATALMAGACASPGLDSEEQTAAPKAACTALADQGYAAEACEAADLVEAEWRKRWMSWFESTMWSPQAGERITSNWAAMGFVQGAQPVALPWYTDELTVDPADRDTSLYLLAGHRAQHNASPGTIQTVSDYVAEFTVAMDQIDAASTSVAIAFEAASAKEVIGLPEFDTYAAGDIGDYQLFCVDDYDYYMATYDDQAGDEAEALGDCDTPKEWARRFEMAGGNAAPDDSTLDLFAGHWTTHPVTGDYDIWAVEQNAECYSESEVDTLKGGGQSIHRSPVVAASSIADSRDRLAEGTDIDFGANGQAMTPAVALASVSIDADERTTVSFNFESTQLDRLRDLVGSGRVAALLHQQRRALHSRFRAGGANLHSRRHAERVGARLHGDRQRQRRPPGAAARRRLRRRCGEVDPGTPSAKCGPRSD